MPAEPSSSVVGHESFAALYSSAHLSLLKFILTLLPDRQTADDVLQETARVLWRKFEQYDPERPFLPWAREFAYFEVLKARRRLAVDRRYFSDALCEQMAAERSDQEDQLELQRAALAECVGKLDPDSRALITHRYERKQTLQAIAAQQNKTANSLYLLLRRIRQGLIDCVNRALRQEGWS